MASMEGKQPVGGYTLFRNRDSLASILCNLNTFILTDTHTDTFKTLASFYLEIQKYIKSETMEHEQSETIDKGKIETQYDDLCRMFSSRETGKQTNN